MKKERTQEERCQKGIMVYLVHSLLSFTKNKM